MNSFRCIAISICLLSTLGSGLAQQMGGKPVLSAEPAKPAPPMPAPKASVQAGPLSPEYIIGADDSLKIEVWKEPQLSTTLTVRPDGKISLPLINDIMAAGFTSEQLGENISAQLTKFVTDPVVNVSVLQVNSKNVFMIGNVGHVGSIPIAPGMTILQAIASAGGLTPYANGKHIYILRGDPGKQQKVFFDYNKAVKKGTCKVSRCFPATPSWSHEKYTQFRFQVLRPVRRVANCSYPALYAAVYPCARTFYRRADHDDGFADAGAGSPGRGGCAGLHRLCSAPHRGHVELWGERLGEPFVGLPREPGSLFRDQFDGQSGLHFEQQVVSLQHGLLRRSLLVDVGRTIL